MTRSSARLAVAAAAAKTTFVDKENTNNSSSGVGNSSKAKIIKAQKFIRKSDMLKGNKIGNLTGIYDAKKLGKVFQKKIGHEDYLMWIQIVNLSKFSFGCLDNLATYTISKKGVSSNKLKSISWTWNIYRNELKMNLISSLISLIRNVLYILKR